jgi:hypothetical protein
MRRLFVWTLSAVLLALAACDSERIAKLEEGLSTETDVRKQFGEPVTVTVNADGSKLMEYPRQPEGQTNYFITIGADGKMSSLRQVLTRSTLGRPAAQTRVQNEAGDTWSWRFADGQTAKVFNVRFDAQGIVIATNTGDDPRGTQIGGN